MADEKEARDRRLAEALRANLHRRKGQSRTRDTLRESGDGAGGPDLQSATQSATQPDNVTPDWPAPGSPAAGPDAVGPEPRGRR